MGRHASAAPTAGALLVRVPLGDGADLAALPAVPPPRTCTVTVNLVDVHGLAVDELGARGYLLGPHANARADAAPCADVLVPGPLATNDDWVAPLLAVAERVFALDLGPVRRVFARELAAHAQLVDDAAGAQDLSVGRVCDEDPASIIIDTRSGA